MSLDPNKTYLVWNGSEFPNSTIASFKAPARSTIDWGDGTFERFDTASITRTEHAYGDGKTEHKIAISGLTSIDVSAFNNCTSLTNVTIGNSVTSIGIAAFYSCSSLTSITIPNSVMSIGHSAFIKTAYCNDENNWENGVLYIGKHLIKAKTDLSGAYTIKDGTMTIAGYAFYKCGSLTSITIPNSVTSIDERVFYNCSSLASVIIPDSVTSIGYEAFAYCSSLIQLILFPSTPMTLWSNSIPSTIQSIYVQQSSKAAYQAARNWKAFASKIVSDNIYLSFVRFNQKNKEYIDKKLVSALSEFGGKLYKHMLNIKKSSGEFFVLTFLSPTSIAITNATLIDNDSNWILGATGFSSTGFACICVSLTPESGLVLFGNGNAIQILYSEVTNITDTVIQP